MPAAATATINFRMGVVPLFEFGIFEPGVAFAAITRPGLRIGIPHYVGQIAPTEITPTLGSKRSSPATAVAVVPQWDGFAASIPNQIRVHNEASYGNDCPASLFVVTRFIGFFRDNRMNAVTTNKNALKVETE